MPRWGNAGSPAGLKLDFELRSDTELQAQTLVVEARKRPFHGITRGVDYGDR